MAVTFDSSAGAAMGSTTCQPPSPFLSVVVSPDSDLMRSPSSLSDSTDARIFSSGDTSGLGCLATPKRIYANRPARITMRTIVDHKPRIYRLRQGIALGFAFDGSTLDCNC